MKTIPVRLATACRTIVTITCSQSLSTVLFGREFVVQYLICTVIVRYLDHLLMIVSIRKPLSRLPMTDFVINIQRPEEDGSY